MKKYLLTFLLALTAAVLFGNTIAFADEFCDHDWYEENVTPATLSADGSVTYYCSDCDETKAETIARIKTVKLSKTTYTFNGDFKYPAVKVWDSAGNRISDDYYWVYYDNNYDVGKAKVTVEFNGYYSGTKKLSFTIKPRGTSIKKLLPQPKGFRVIWKERYESEDGVEGFQIQYSRNKNFKSGNKKITVKSGPNEKRVVKLKAKKRYYVRVRTFNKVGSRKYYSAWSGKKHVRSKGLKNTRSYCHNLMAAYPGFWLVHCEIVNEYPTYYECKATVLTGTQHWTPYEGPREYTRVRIRKNATVSMWISPSETRKMTLAHYMKRYGSSGIRIDMSCTHNAQGYIIQFRDAEAG